MSGLDTKLTVRVLSCDAKIIGSLVGGCRITVTNRRTGEPMASGLHLGGSGATDSIMAPWTRGETLFDTSGTAAFRTMLSLEEPVEVEISAEGPLSFAHAAQRTAVTTWLIPGQHVEGDGIVLKLHGFIVEIMNPAGVEVFRTGQPIDLEAGVRLL